MPGVGYAKLSFTPRPLCRAGLSMRKERLSSPGAQAVVTRQEAPSSEKALSNRPRRGAAPAGYRTATRRKCLLYFAQADPPQIHRGDSGAPSHRRPRCRLLFHGIAHCAAAIVVFRKLHVGVAPRGPCIADRRAVPAPVGHGTQGRTSRYSAYSVCMPVGSAVKANSPLPTVSGLS
jgi:hypothetical protein